MRMITYAMSAGFVVAVALSYLRLHEVNLMFPLLTSVAFGIVATIWQLFDAINIWWLGRNRAPFRRHPNDR